MKTNTQTTEGKDPQQTKDESSLDGAACSPAFSDTPIAEAFAEYWGPSDIQRSAVATIESLELGMNEWKKKAQKAMAYRKVMKRANNDLRAWKNSAMKVFDEWEKTWEAAGSPGRLGQSKASALREFIMANAERIHPPTRKLPTTTKMSQISNSPTTPADSGLDAANCSPSLVAEIEYAMTQKKVCLSDSIDRESNDDASGAAYYKGLAVAYAQMAQRLRYLLPNVKGHAPTGEGKNPTNTEQ